MGSVKLDNARRMRKHPTKPEEILWGLLRRKSIGARVHRQHPMWGYIADFYIPAAALCVEVDGGYHQQRNDADNLRDFILKRHGIMTLRLTNERVISDQNGVISEIQNLVNCRS